MSISLKPAGPTAPQCQSRKPLPRKVASCGVSTKLVSPSQHDNIQAVGTFMTENVIAPNSAEMQDLDFPNAEQGSSRSTGVSDSQKNNDFNNQTREEEKAALKALEKEKERQKEAAR